MTKIYCPKCKWEPDAQSRWVCRPGCGYMWNTFQTGAVCPNCSKQFKYTQCLRCGVSSLHREWYHDEDEHGEEELALFRDFVERELQKPAVEPAAGAARVAARYLTNLYSPGRT